MIIECNTHINVNTRGKLNMMNDINIMQLGINKNIKEYLDNYILME